MKIFGWICIVIGGLSFLGAALNGSNITGPSFWIGLGIFLVYYVSKKTSAKG